MKVLAGILHTISCRGKEHAGSMSDLKTTRDSTKCYYYLEENIFGADLPDHIYWEGEAAKLCEQLNTSPDDVIRILASLVDTKRKLDVLLSRHPTAVSLAIHLLFDEHCADVVEDFDVS